MLMDCSQDERPDHGLGDYIRIAEWLNGVGLKAPEIYEKEKNYLIIEDLGEVSFKKAMAKEKPEELYALAADVLAHLRAQKNLPALPSYYDSNIHQTHRRVIDWYAPTIRHKKNPDGLVEEYLNVWAQIEKTAPVDSNNFVHADFHVENLLFLPNEKGLKRCAIIDFQDALRGPALYDLGNLLEDVRADIPPVVKNKYAPRDPAYRILATQFHCRVVGQFIRMAARDHKTGYLQYIPRTQAYIRAALQDPVLAPLKKFFDKNGITFDTKPDLAGIKSFVRPDAV